MNQQIKYACLSTLFFSIMQVFVKGLSHMPTVQVVFIRGLIASVLCLLAARHLKVNLLGKRQNRRWLIQRGVLGTLALSLGFYTMQRAPLGIAVSLTYMSPLFIVVIARIWFKEKPFVHQWVAILVAICSIYLLFDVGHAIELKYLVTGLIAAFGAAGAYSTIRRIGPDEHPMSIIFYFPMITTLVFLYPVVVSWQTPSLIDWSLLAGVGLSVQIAQVYMTKAYQSDELSNIASIKYFGIVLATGFGVTLFGESLSWEAFFCLIMITLSAIIGSYKPRRRKVDPACSAEKLSPACPRSAN